MPQQCLGRLRVVARTVAEVRVWTFGGEGLWVGWSLRGEVEVLGRKRLSISQE